MNNRCALSPTFSNVSVANPNGVVGVNTDVSPPVVIVFVTINFSCPSAPSASVIASPAPAVTRCVIDVVISTAPAPC